MPCDKLAVQTATLAENFNALMLDDATKEMLRLALANTLKTEITVRLDGSRLAFTGGGTSIYVSKSGEIQIVSRLLTQAGVANVMNTITPIVKAAAQRATQNVVLAAMQRAGVKVGNESTTPNGARVVQFALF